MNVILLKYLDRFFGKLVGSLLSYHLKTLKAVDYPKRIAVIRLWAIGESILALPAIRALKQHWPDSEITALTTPRVAPVFQGQPFIDRTDIVLPHRLRFDLVIDFEPYFYASALLARMLGRYSLGFDTLSRGRLYTKAVPYRDDQHVVKTNFDLVQGVGVEARVPDTLIPIQTLPHPSTSLRVNPLIVIAPGGNVDYRRWPAERFAEVADYLIKKYKCTIVLVGDKADTLILRSVQEKMKNSAQVVSNVFLSEVAVLLSRCRLAIANDGGLMHISAAMGTPTLGLFGPETPARMGPYGPNNRALYHQLGDNPIINVSRGEVPGMLHAKGDLSSYVRAITVDEVIFAADEMLSEERTPVVASKTSVTEMACIS